MAKLIHKNNKPFVPEPKRNGGADLIAIILLFAAIASGFAFLITDNTLMLAAAVISFIISVLIFIVNSPHSASPSYTPPEKAYGNIGEKKAEFVLENYLPDEYTVIQNIPICFNGDRSEIDNLVIGRTGVFIVEVKNLKGLIVGNCEEKIWKQYKTDQYGKEHIDENKNPVMQVSRQIRILKEYLKANGVKTYIRGVVYFTDKEMKLQLIGEPKKDIHIFNYKQTKELLSYIKKGDANLSDKTINRIIDLLS
ncbi:MAG: NERD domain-containing protein [Eubacterium sp.]|nr:NERD domain-containing protein [Eubacterium sp.]